MYKRVWVCVCVSSPLVECLDTFYISTFSIFICFAILWNCYVLKLFIEYIHYTYIDALCFLWIRLCLVFLFACYYTWMHFDYLMWSKSSCVPSGYSYTLAYWLLIWNSVTKFNHPLLDIHSFVHVLLVGCKSLRQLFDFYQSANTATEIPHGISENSLDFNDLQHTCWRSLAFLCCAWVFCCERKETQNRMIFELLFFISSERKDESNSYKCTQSGNSLE